MDIYQLWPLRQTGAQHGRFHSRETPSRTVIPYLPYLSNNVIHLHHIVETTTSSNSYLFVAPFRGFPVIFLPFESSCWTVCRETDYMINRSNQWFQGSFHGTASFTWVVCPRTSLSLLKYYIMCFCFCVAIHETPLPFCGLAGNFRTPLPWLSSFVTFRLHSLTLFLLIHP